MSCNFFSTEDFVKWEERYRTKLMNCLTGFNSALLIATIDTQKRTNLAIFTSCFHLGANPPLIGFVVRPHTVPRHTLENILETSFYTINHVSSSFYKEAHQTSARYQKEISEFDAVGLTPFYHEKMIAPYVKESALGLGMKFLRTINIEENNTILVIGEVIKIRFQDEIIKDDGFLDLEKINAVCALGLDSYHETKTLSRLKYAKPNLEPISSE